MAHPSVQHVADLFDFKPVSDSARFQVEALREDFKAFADELAERLPNQPEVTVALRALMDAKNWAILAVVAEATKEEQP